MIAAMAAVLLAVYGIGQATTEKQKVVNTADAAVYSAATIQARALNFEAYLNRSIVANEVVIAQLVTMDSWLHYMARLSKNISYVAQFIPYVGKAVAQALEKAADFMEMIATKAIPPAMRAQWAMVATLNIAREGAHLVSHGTSMEVAKSVVASNATHFGNRSDAAPQITPFGMAVMAKNAMAWNAFTKTYGKHGGSGDERSNAADVILRSRDRVSGDAERKSGTINLVAFGTEKTTGGTRLVGYDRWEAQDTLDFWRLRVRRFRLRKDYVWALGWGRASASSDGSIGNRWSAPGQATNLAYRNNHKLTGWKGIPELRDVVDRKATYDPDADAVSKHDPKRLTFLIEVAKNRGNIPFGSTLGLGGQNTGGPAGSPHVAEELANNRISALARAEVYFKRPSLAADVTGQSFLRRDGATEHGSLYNPYWQARLTDISISEKAAAYIVSGTGALTPFTPGGDRKE